MRSCILLLILTVVLGGCAGSRSGGTRPNQSGLVPSECASFDKGERGALDLAPLRVFDDGHWTYFQYGSGNLDAVQNLPVIYAVQDGVDTPVNNRILKGFIIVESKSAIWTIKSGDKYLCVRQGGE